MTPPDRNEAPLWRRLGWMVAIWAGSIAALAAVATALRLVLAR
jgi:hypothetical protein